MYEHPVGYIILSFLLWYIVIFIDQVNYSLILVTYCSDLKSYFAFKDLKKLKVNMLLV